MDGPENWHKNIATDCRENWYKNMVMDGPENWHKRIVMHCREHLQNSTSGARGVSPSTVHTNIVMDFLGNLERISSDSKERACRAS